MIVCEICLGFMFLMLVWVCYSEQTGDWKSEDRDI